MISLNYTASKNTWKIFQIKTIPLSSSWTGAPPFFICVEYNVFVRVWLGVDIGVIHGTHISVVFPKFWPLVLVTYTLGALFYSICMDCMFLCSMFLCAEHLAVKETLNGEQTPYQGLVMTYDIWHLSKCLFLLMIIIPFYWLLLIHTVMKFIFINIPCSYSVVLFSDRWIATYLERLKKQLLMMDHFYISDLQNIFLSLLKAMLFLFLFLDAFAVFLFLTVFSCT